MTMAGPPVPIPDALTQPFWSAVSERRLVIQRCVQCSRYHHPPVGLCPDCLSEDFEFEAVSGHGHVRAITRTHVARDPYFSSRAPYIVAIVELVECSSLLMMSNFPFNPADKVKIDAPVVIDFEAIGSDQLIPQFRLAERG